MDIAYWQKRCQLAENVIQTDRSVLASRLDANQAFTQWQGYKAMETIELGSVINLRIDKLEPGTYKLALLHGATKYPICEFDITVNKDETVDRKMITKPQ